MKNFYKRGMLMIMFLLAMAFLVLLAMGQAKAATPAFNSTYSFQQEITGKVTDPKGQPLLGVTVILKNKNVGVTTNLEGNYTIGASNGDVLVFSFIGYESREIEVGNQSQINVSLEEDVAALDEVQINAGYYNTTKRESTGNISRVTAEEIDNQPVVSPLQALQGRMAGVEVTSGGINPGAAPAIRIRGTNSLRAEGNYPLYIIDGVPINSTPIESNSLIGNAGIDPLNNLAISNIESIEVLKDADATAIYGSRGANGVVLITTKKGRAGTGLEASFYTGAASVPKRLDLLNTQEYLQIRRRAFENDEVEPTERNAYDLLLWDQDRYTDWQEFLYGGHAEVTNANIAFTGGSEFTTFRLGGSYFMQGTVYPGEYDYQKGTGNMSLNHYSKDEKFNINGTINYGVDSNNLVGNVGFNTSISLLPPNAPSVFNKDGSLNWEEWGEAGLNNPLQGYFNSSDTETKSFTSNIIISYKILSGLQFKTSLGFTDYQSEELWKLPARSYNPSNEPENYSLHLISNRKSWIIEPQFIFNKNLGKLKTDFLVGATMQKNESNKSSFQGSGYASESLIGNLGSAESILNASSENTEYRYAAIFSRLGLNWDKKYYLNFTGRRDGSSRFGPNNRFANFGAIGAAWIFSEEVFIEDNLPFLSFGKIRGSFGTTGNDQIGDYGYLDAYEATIGSGGLFPSSLANPDYSWEVNKKFETALEIGFMNDRINLGVSWYRNRSSNQLVGYTLPSITGFTSVQANLPATVENQGVEIEINTLNLTRGNFTWKSNFNFTIPKNELIRYPGIEQSSYANTYREGYPLNIALLYDYDGLDPETGFYKINDINGDERLDFEDRVIIKDLNREFYGGLNNNLTYKGFALQFFLQFVNQEGKQSYFNAGTPNNLISSVLDDNSFQKYSRSSQSSTAFRNVSQTTFPYEDASFIRLKTLSFSYNLPNSFLDSTNIKQCQVFLHGQNLLTFTPYSGLDPESPLSGSSIGNLRSITAGIQVNL